jgi:hypothetical protein
MVLQGRIAQHNREKATPRTEVYRANGGIDTAHRERDVVDGLDLRALQTLITFENGVSLTFGG